MIKRALFRLAGQASAVEQVSNLLASPVGQVSKRLASLVGQVFHLPALHQSSLPALLTLGLFGCPALAQTNLPPHPIPESQRWATITHPGNAPRIQSPEYPPNYPFPVGRVDYEYQISRTEVTGAEWFEFVLAYAPYVAENSAGSVQFTSTYIRSTEVAPGQYHYSLRPGGENRPVEVSWRHAARYVNWLHNNKAPNPEAFESGAYDASTFGDLPEGGFSDQVARSPGATYWFPSIDEWVKAAYFDPDRHGEGMPGYWLYPHSSDAPPIPGLPVDPTGLAGQTSAGFCWSCQGHPEPEVAAYIGAQSPWGLFDLSGGTEEWLENRSFDPDSGVMYRYTKGTKATGAGSADVEFFDHIDWATGTDPGFDLIGLRLARAVPPPASPAAGVAAMIVLSVINRRR